MVADGLPTEGIGHQQLLCWPFSPGILRACYYSQNPDAFTDALTNDRGQLMGDYYWCTINGLNPSRPSDAQMRQQTGPSLVEMITCLFFARSLSEPMLNFCWFDSWGQNITTIWIRIQQNVDTSKITPKWIVENASQFVPIYIYIYIYMCVCVDTLLYIQRTTNDKTSKLPVTRGEGWGAWHLVRRFP